MLRVLTALVTGALVVLLLAAPPASGQDDITWGVRPADNALGAGRANFGYTAVPGAAISDELLVTNHETRSLTFRVYAADAFTTSSGQLDLLPAGKPSAHVGTWVRFAAEEVTVPAGQALAVPFTLSVPAGTTPGDHSGGVVTSLAVADNGVGITVDRRLGARMHVRVGGDLVPRLEVRDLRVSFDGSANPFARGVAKVSYTVANVGNTRLTAGQRVRVEGLFGWFGQDAEVAALPELLPGEGATREVSVPSWPAGRVSATVEVTGAVPGGAGVDPVADSDWDLAVPWAAVIAALVVLCLALALRARTRSRKAAEEERIAAAVAEALKRSE
ncbi:DUF916 domain-containing protein [Actinosynnema sp. NPDC050436]|uniref:WxL protein peptidoglycan domain-containing protein n=1 Tax=Actinosynnema sp. NPDC050436 TaxID=3155659 RepID=UPI0033E7CDB1